MSLPHQPKSPTIRLNQRQVRELPFWVLENNMSNPSVHLQLGENPAIYGLPWWLRWLRICLQCGRAQFDPWVWKIPWTRAWQPTAVFLPGESPWTEEHLAGYSPWGCKELDTTEWLSTRHSPSYLYGYCKALKHQSLKNILLSQQLPLIKCCEHSAAVILSLSFHPFLLGSSWTQEWSHYSNPTC